MNEKQIIPAQDTKQQKESASLSSNDQVYKNTGEAPSIARRVISSHNQKMTIPISSLVDFSNHSFSVDDDDAMALLADSIVREGIHVPLIVRQFGEKYEIISGHRRRHAAELAGLKEVPAVVMTLNDIEATDMMFSTNYQRLDLKPSERARIYKHAIDVRKHQGIRADETTLDEVSRLFKSSTATIKRYLRLLKLDKVTLDLVDSGSIPLTTAFERAGSQLCNNASTPKKPPERRISFKFSEFEGFFPLSMSDKEIKAHILELLRSDII